jgi:heat shock protein HslJ
MCGFVRDCAFAVIDRPRGACEIGGRTFGGVVMVACRCTVALLTLTALLTAGTAPTAADQGFPYDKELLLDAKPMKGSKRLPILTIAPSGTATIDLWCDSAPAQFAVTGNALTITPGAKTGRQCDPARMKGDDDLLATLEQVTTWQRQGSVLTLNGTKALRFRATTN